MKETIVVAIGGNSLIKDKEHKTVQDQYNNIAETCQYVADIVETGVNLVICHGNGPQVGFILRRSDIARKYSDLHQVPLSSCVANTQGAIGFQIQMALENELRSRGLKQEVITLTTRVVVDKNDIGFQNPTKPIGSFFSLKQMEDLQKEYPDWNFIQDAGRGYRRVVASPCPKDIIEINAIKDMIAKSYIVIACGGGGIPVIENNNKSEPIDAVIDKDLASELIAEKINAKSLIISTNVSHVYINFGKINEKRLENIHLTEIKKYVLEDHFAKGSMLPKIEAAIKFLENGGEKVIITSPENIKKGIDGKTGTIIKSL